MNVKNVKSRLFIVDENSINRVKNSGEVSIMVPEPHKYTQSWKWNQILLDIITDLMQIEVGDYVFLWKTGKTTGKKSCIYGVYRVVSSPYYKYEQGRNDIFRIKIDRAYIFKEPIYEYDFINNPHMKSKLWNIIGKKVAGKSRGTSPITLEEAEILIQALIDKNNKFKYISKYTEKKVNNKVSIDLCNEYVNQMPNTIATYQYEPIRIRSGKEVHFEKALECIINKLLREDREIVELEIKDVIWYANYLPYGMDGSEIDYMIMESKDGRNITRINVIELMKSNIDVEHIEKVLRYSKWVVNSICNDSNIVRPILICGIKSLNAKNGIKNLDIKKALKQIPKDQGFQKVDVYTYLLENGKIEFNKIY